MVVDLVMVVDLAMQVQPQTRQGLVERVERATKLALEVQGRPQALVPVGEVKRQAAQNH